MASALLQRVFDKRPSWQVKANCRDHDLSLFFPERGESTREAKAICEGCPVRSECLEFALMTPLEKFGVWGGTSERQRRQIRAHRRAWLEAS